LNPQPFGRMKKIRTPRVYPTNTAPRGAGAEHTHQLFDESWDHARASASFLCLARRACIEVRGLEAPDKTSGAGGLPLLLASEVNDASKRSSVMLSTTPGFAPNEELVDCYELFHFYLISILSYRTSYLINILSRDPGSILRRTCV